MTRRRFLQSSAAMAATTSMNPGSLSAAQATQNNPGVSWPIGCFNRPWSGEKHKWSYDVALDGMRAAGYRLTGLLSRLPDEPLAGSDATPDYLTKLKDRIAARGLKANMAALRNRNDLALDG